MRFFAPNLSLSRDTLGGDKRTYPLDASIIKAAFSKYPNGKRQSKRAKGWFARS
jgi:hypothetical protein